jgi:hypothetical protein
MPSEKVHARMRRIVAATCLLLLSIPAHALVGGAAPADGMLGRHAVMIVGSRGNFCTGTAIARDLVLTAAHCVLPGADYKVYELDAERRPVFRDVAGIARHPQFSLQTLLSHRATADLALVKTAEPLPARYIPAQFGDAGAVMPGDSFLVTGFGLATRADPATGGALRRAALVATGKPGNVQIRLTDPGARNDRGGLGACTGDSGAPVFDARAVSAVPMVIGVVSWSTGPGNSAGCGGLTGVTPLALYRRWIVEAARTLGTSLGPPSLAP